MALLGKALIAVVLVAVCYAAIVVVVNRLSRPAPRDIPVAGTEGLPGATDALRLTTWNLGYAGLGKESDFVTDGGEMLRPPSKAIVEKNLQGIVATLPAVSGDVLLMQEVAEPSFFNYRTDVRRVVEDTLNGYATSFRADTVTRALIPPLRLSLGTLIASSRAVAGAALEPLPLEPGYSFGFLRKHYGVHVVRLAAPEGSPSWVVMNVHLAAFDDGASVRHDQLARVIEIAHREYAAGHHVVVGGDWNLVLRDTPFPHDTANEHLFWVYPFPAEMLPEGWTLAADPATPTVRTNHQPYRAGDNFTTIIDGFLLSPNVDLVDIRTHDLAFEYTDHQPVEMTVRAKADE